VAQAEWFPVRRLPPLAFDHQRIVDYALERLRNKINYTTVGFQLLPRQFTLTELQGAYEVILGRRLDKRNFRRKMLQLGILRDTLALTANGRQRPARLYTFTEPKVIKLQEKGIIVPF
jgi:8-oxo-dGTP diphosphatase